VYRLSSFTVRLIIGLLLGFTTVTMMACTQQASPSASEQSSSPIAQAVPSGAPVVIASPTSLTPGADGMVSFITMGFTGAGWDKETVVYLELLLPDGTAGMLGAGICKNGAFNKSAGMPGMPGGTMLKLDPGAYTLRATGKTSGKIAYFPISIATSGGMPGGPPSGGPPSGAPPSGALPGGAPPSGALPGGAPPSGSAPPAGMPPLPSGMTPPGGMPPPP
jgi:hypothetical protein